MVLKMSALVQTYIFRKCWGHEDGRKRSCKESPLYQARRKWMQKERQTKAESATGSCKILAPDSY
jgi:hypothetical protein